MVKNPKDDLKEALLVIDALNNYIEKGEPYPEFLIERGYQAWARLEDWRTDSPVAQKELDDLKNTILDQLDLKDVLLVQAEIEGLKEECRRKSEKRDKLVSKHISPANPFYRTFLRAVKSH